MPYYNTVLTPELKDLALSLADSARDAGLDFFDTIFELVDYKQLSEIAAYGGFPTRYPHWRFGMEYERISKSYTYGLSIIYEMVINNDPCYAYLLRANNMVSQKTVIAHVYGHCDFFKNNYWFSKTNRKMLDQMANHASIVRRYIEAVGHDEVENFLDCCLSLENLIDIHALQENDSQQIAAKIGEDDDEIYRDPQVAKLKAKKYMDSYINPKEFIDAQKQKQIQQKSQDATFPGSPQKDVLKFLIENAPLNQWEKRILSLVRNEAIYYAPQGQTKILNEGWATYWHSRMMTELAPLKDSEIIEYCDQYAGIVASPPGQINPYKVGIELLRHVKNRWDKGKFGIDYVNCDDPRERSKWNTEAGLGIEKLYEVRRIHNDITFIDAFLDEDFCHEHKMFIYDFDRRSNKYVISSRQFSEIKQQLLKQLTNFGQPVISVIDSNYKNRGELLLSHNHDGTDLKLDFSNDTLKNLFRIWKRPVHIETAIEDVKKRITFDGSSNQIEKV